MHCLARDERGDGDGEGGRKRSRMVNRGGGWKKREKERRATDARKCPDVNAINLLRTLHFNIYPGDAHSLTSFPFSPSSSPRLLLRFFLVLVSPALALLSRATLRLISSFFFRTPHIFPVSLFKFLRLYLPWWNRAR